MKIKQLTLKNFRNHEYTNLDLTVPISVVTGLNASGKSSLKEALMYALIGEGETVLLEKTS